MVSIVKTNFVYYDYYYDFHFFFILIILLLSYLKSFYCLYCKVHFSCYDINYSSRTFHLLSLSLLSLIHLFLCQLSCKFCQIWTACSPWKCHSLIFFSPSVLYFLKVSVFVYNTFFTRIILRFSLSSVPCCLSLDYTYRYFIVIGRTDAEAGASILFPPDEKRWLFEKDPDAGKDQRPKEKGAAENQMIRQHHQLNGHESE